MSRIGRQPISLGQGVEVTIEDATVAVKGPRGNLSQVLPSGITASLEDRQVIVKRRDDSAPQRALHGLSRSLIANAVHGVDKGFSKVLEIHGVGFGAEAKGRTLVFKLGYSHTIDFELPAGIEVKIARNVLTVSGCDRQLVGRVAAEIRDLRRPDVYKQKGIRYADEHLRKKAGKAGVK